MVAIGGLQNGGEQSGHFARWKAQIALCRFAKDITYHMGTFILSAEPKVRRDPFFLDGWTPSLIFCRTGGPSSWTRKQEAANRPGQEAKYPW